MIFSSERKAILQEAVTEAKLSRKLQAQAMENAKSTARYTYGRKPSKRTMEQGRSRLLMEEMVRRAERKLSELKRKQDAGRDFETRAEDLASELFHEPGVLLTQDEMNFLYYESGCHNITRGPRRWKCYNPLLMVYRTIDGTCNNLEKTGQGAAGVPFRRAVPPLYEDGVSAPMGRMQAYNYSLAGVGPFQPPKPSARLVSMKVVKDVEENETLQLTHMVMQWGQFIDHDISLSTESEVANCSGCVPTEGGCEPIIVPPNDPVFGSQGCLEFRRSIPACIKPTRNRLPPREQINELTSYIDGSQVYGNNMKMAKSLRVGEFMLTESDNLPLDSEGFYRAGDIRVNEQAGLTAMHTLWVREHNRVADELTRLNPHWTKLKVWLESRKIVGAQLQQITFWEYLPNVLGPALAIVGEYDGYDDTADASVVNEFVTAGYRFGHSLVRPVFDRFLTDAYENGENKPLNLLASFFNTTAFRETDIAAILRGLMTDVSLRADEFINNILSEHLFEGSIIPHGSDLASLNIQRQRDHGMAPYFVVRNFCLRLFPYLPMPVIANPLTRARLLEVYGSLDAVDLWLGGLAEERINGSLLGPTFACIVAATFKALRDGDRFWYENPGVFAPEQLDEIYKTTLSKVICDNTNVNMIQYDPFVSDKFRVNCSYIDGMDLSKWQESCYIKVESDEKIKFDVTYRYGGITHSTKKALISNSQGGTTCVPIMCPQYNDERLNVIARKNFRQNCRAEGNSNLPPDVSNAPYRYRGRGITADLIDADTGIYSSKETCENGESKAIEFECSLGDVGPEDEVEEDSIDSLSSDSSSKSPVLPEEYVQEEIAAIKHAKEHYVSRRKMKKTKVLANKETENDNALLEELENTLKKLD